MVPPGLQQLEGVLGDAVFHLKALGVGDHVDVRQVDQPLGGHAIVHRVHDALQGAGDDAGPARRANGQEGSAVPQDHAGGHAGQGGLAALDGVGTAIGQPLTGEGSHRRGEVGHGVVQHKAIAAHHDAAAEPVPNGLGLGDGVAEAVHHRKVRGVAGIVLGGDVLRRGVILGLRPALGKALGGKRLGDQPVGVHVDKVRVAQGLAPVCKA